MKNYSYLLTSRVAVLFRNIEIGLTNILLDHRYTFQEGKEEDTYKIEIEEGRQNGIYTGRTVIVSKSLKLFC